MDRTSGLGAGAPISIYARIAREVADLAQKEMEASGLPGRFGGPADAYRHMIGVGELARRLGVLTAYAISEANELRSERAGYAAGRAGRAVPPANTPEAISMDRHTNMIGLGIGQQALTFENVVVAARADQSRRHGRLGFCGPSHLTA